MFVARKLNIKNSSSVSSGSLLTSDSPKYSKTTTKEKAKSTKESLLNFISAKKLSASPQKEEPSENMIAKGDLEAKDNRSANGDEVKVVSESESTETKLENTEGDLEVNGNMPANIKEAEVTSKCQTDTKENLFEATENALETTDWSEVKDEQKED